MIYDRLMDTYPSYFGAFTCVTWSPDGRFVLTGGQDDLISIFSPSEQRLLARCSGHTSYITRIDFDENDEEGVSQSLKDDWRVRRPPRFGSVGEDGRVILVRVACLPWTAADI